MGVFKEQVSSTGQHKYGGEFESFLFYVESLFHTAREGKVQCI